MRHPARCSRPRDQVFRERRGVGFFAVFAASAAALAGEAPNILVQPISTHTIYTATPASSSLPGFKPHINFPYMKQRADGTLAADFTVGQTQSGAVFGVRGFSSDGGRNWGGFLTPTPAAPNAQLVAPAGQQSLGFSFATSGSGVTSFLGTRFASSDGGTNWSAVNCSFSTGGVGYSSLYNNYQDVVRSGTALLTTAYGVRTGSTTQELVLFASTDSGETWTRRSTVASFDPNPTLEMGSEGPSEGSVIALDNGKLLSVFRTGQPFPGSDLAANGPPLMWSISGDSGQSWSTPKTLGVAGVFPLLRKLPDGHVALSYGRYGAKLMFADPSGMRWTRPTVVYNGPGSGHTELRRNASDGTYAFVYDQSSFYPPPYNAAPPAAYVYDNGQSANAKLAVLSITPAVSSDEFNWAGEYHADVAPDLASPAWNKSIAGAPTQRLTADLGQDYIEIVTNTAPTNTVVYRHGGVGSTWDSMNFADGGAVIELRGRVLGGGSGEGAADVAAGDGNAGFAFQIAGAGVYLEGAGGNGAQVSYASGVAGFSTTVWHDYRIVLKPDPTAGGAVVARVYLDGNFAAPILTKPLAASAMDAIEFGDRSPAVGGVMHLDYLRYSALNTAWTVDAGGNFGSLANWTTTVPNTADAVATLGSAITAPRTINLGAPITLGHLRFDSPHSYTLGGAAGITLAVTGGTATLQPISGAHYVRAPLTLASNTVLVAGAGALQVGQLSIPGDKWLELGRGDLVVDYSGASSRPVVEAQVRFGLIRSIDSSAVAALGVAEVAETPYGSTYRGLSLDGSAVLVRYTLRGDADLDGTVDIDDFGRLAASFNLSGRWATGDFNYSGGVDIDDFGLLAANFNQSPSAAGVNPRASIPEPSGLGIALLTCLRRRR